mmetsp:Transcript_52377/g.145147  ORF Transcript_52377/g.145147 Transcript_52377/m.145147 type:complete len:266 (-) Transcript_52377:122-919(-)|eukprot:CAMPEP_0179067336 /NCGR_PEP_ID=MMETSP0796-20121207/29436_1 /TAXON_ID=73915 /ORGANISM="Pyrodinium bahamense, Strain pbaha01" /LENGTH=265 /DNA_ID=CAMNT_0020764361 /DNA_START=96 /DNA_END=893 /DNA_ORIENTATION=+
MATVSWYGGFEWRGAPFSHWRWPVLGVVAYLLCVWILSAVMQSRKAFELRHATAVHNLLLSIGSLAMFLGTLFELQRRYASSGTFLWFFCEDAAVAQGSLYFWTYVYYLSKYYEMLDTVLVLLQKSRVPHFRLQVFHHAAVVPTVWLWCQQRQSLQWGGLLFNTFVHVVMYQYYAFKVLGLPTPWKRWITKLQIVQFVSSFILLLVTLWIFFHKTNGDTCAGMSALVCNICFNATLLVQFIGVDRRNAVHRSEAGADRAAESKRK